MLILVWISSTCHICIIRKVSNEQWSCHHQALSPNIGSMSYQTLWRPWANCFSIDKLDGICGGGLWKWKSWICWSIAQRGLKLADVSLRWFLVGCGICCQYSGFGGKITRILLFCADCVVICVFGWRRMLQLSSFNSLIGKLLVDGMVFLASLWYDAFRLSEVFQWLVFREQYSLVWSSLLRCCFKESLDLWMLRAPSSLINIFLLWYTKAMELSLLYHSSCFLTFVSTSSGLLFSLSWYVVFLVDWNGT